eukprot:CAMPEP_0172529280 /NCGR_PEP_ID=MMETSP1067-20121228/3394_1 /TAXON_ID=265564 ORGANISM="Thalassiosira punctigera, Strain Tpunct2005C2" /NCGR_SAMPLE_ID=MMETSP1067 /ASSEMBLY_ACC=CAM_ASM_000444 /LENGTH=393 /DNA_ID=CAMNT_0013313309 /DNA_START=168 /DNA_END=1346 /DNA_ORIENTATION=+
MIRQNVPPSSSMAALVLVALLTAEIATLRTVSASITTSPQIATMRPYHHCDRHHDPCQTRNQSSILHHVNALTINKIRGGDDDGDDDGVPQYQQLPPQQQMGDSNLQISPPASTSSAETAAGAGGYDIMDGTGGGGTSNDQVPEYRETVEDRIDAWRRQQQQLQQTQTAADAASVVDGDGRFKLFTTVSRVSVSFFFFILMWRTVHHYELADATFGGGVGVRAAIARIVVVTPLVVLFLGEMMGAILGLTGGSSSSSQQKKRLKGILNLHKGVELVMMFYNVFRLAIWPSKYVVREVFIGRTISNFFFLMQAQLYTKLSWGDVSKSTLGEGSYVTESYYDDYTPEMARSYGDDISTWQSTTTTMDNNHYYGQDDSLEQQQQQQQSYNDDAPGW